MTKYCDACHSANIDRAKYCCYCHGRFSGVRFGAHTTAGAPSDSLPPRGRSRLPSTPARRRERARSTSPAMRAGLLLIFLVLLFGPFTHWNSDASPERWSSVKSSVASAWDWSAASIADTIKPLLTSMSPNGQTEPEPDAAPLTTAAAPAKRSDDAGGKSCTDAQAALSLCPKH